MSDQGDRPLSERFEKRANEERQKSGWSIVVVSIAALVVAVLALTFAYSTVASRDDKRFQQFGQQIKDNRAQIDEGQADRERLNREIDVLKNALTEHNVPIPPDAVDTGTTTTTRPTGGNSLGAPRSTTTTTTRHTATTTTTSTSTTILPPPPPPPASTTTTTSKPCRVPITVPGGPCVL